MNDGGRIREPSHTIRQYAKGSHGGQLVSGLTGPIFSDAFGNQTISQGELPASHA
jgi:hypothetical protein